MGGRGVKWPKFAVNATFVSTEGGVFDFLETAVSCIFPPQNHPPLPPLLPQDICPPASSGRFAAMLSGPL